MYVYENYYAKYQGNILPFLKDVPDDIEESYFKCRRVIRSCRSPEQLNNAKRYIDRWKISTPKKYQYLYKRLDKLWTKCMARYVS